MPITDLLERNSKLYGNEVALVEIDPDWRKTLDTAFDEIERRQKERGAK